MALNKKGMFFTIMVIVIISLLAVSSIFYSTLNDRASTQKRVETMNSFLVSMEQDLQRQIYISGFRAIYLIEKEISDKGSYITNTSALIAELFFNGTLNKNSQSTMVGARFSEIMESINQNSEKISIRVNFSSPSLTAIQTDSWNVRLILRAEMNVTDMNGLAAWRTTKLIEAQIPITNFEDPLYLVSTNGLITNNITRTPFTNFVQGTNIQNLTIHALNSFYKESQTAPSFIDRLEGKTSPNTNGIESLVNLQKFSLQGIPIESKSAVDYIYLSPSSLSSSHIAGMPSWFRLDSAHLSAYNASSLVE